MLITSDDGSAGGVFPSQQTPRCSPRATNTYTHRSLTAFRGTGRKKSWSEMGVLWCAAPTAAISHFLPPPQLFPARGRPGTVLHVGQSRATQPAHGSASPYTRYHSEGCKLLCMLFNGGKKMTEGDTKHAPRSRLSPLARPPGHTQTLPSLSAAPTTRAPPAAYIRWRVTLQYSRTGQVLRGREEGRGGERNEVGGVRWGVRCRVPLSPTFTHPQRKGRGRGVEWACTCTCGHDGGAGVGGGRGGRRVSRAKVRLTLSAPSHHHQALAYIGATGISAPLINAWDLVRVCNPTLSHTKIINNHICRLETLSGLHFFLLPTVTTGSFTSPSSSHSLSAVTVALLPPSPASPPRASETRSCELPTNGPP